MKQAISQWCFKDAIPNGWSLEEMCQIAKSLDLPALEVVHPSDFPILQKHNLICALTTSHLFIRGMNNPLHWKECLGEIEASIEANSAAGFPNVVTFTGFLNTREESGSVVTPEEAIKNCVEGYKKIVGLAEKKKVTLCLEPLNTRDPGELKGHPGYQGNHVDIIVEIIDKVGSPALKMLFDVYHVQIMDGDLVRRIGELKEYIAHVQIAGVPGRGEPDSSQEINYPAVIRALKNIGYAGYIAHEWIPVGNPLKNLTAAVAMINEAI